MQSLYTVRVLWSYISLSYCEYVRDNTVSYSTRTVSAQLQIHYHGSPWINSLEDYEICFRRLGRSHPLSIYYLCLFIKFISDFDHLKIGTLTRIWGWRTFDPKASHGLLRSLLLLPLVLSKIVYFFVFVLACFRHYLGQCFY